MRIVASIGWFSPTAEVDDKSQLYYIRVNVGARLGDPSLAPLLIRLNPISAASHLEIRKNET
jgi:hypothetical protein